MNETLVDIEVARLLKEVGFIWSVRHFFKYADTDKPEANEYHPDNYNGDNWAKGYYSRPTLSRAADWLRTQGLHVYCSITLMGTYTWTIQDIQHGKILQSGYLKKKDHDTALAAGIKQALTILKERK